MNTVEIRTYKARTQEDAAKSYTKDASKMARKGYSPVSQSWADGRSGVLRFLMLGGIGALVFKPKGTLTVTYKLDPAPQGVPVTH